MYAILKKRVLETVSCEVINDYCHVAMTGREQMS